jgi:hypothetical protein
MSDAPPPAAPAADAQQPEGPSKNALKKAQKEKEKVESCKHQLTGAGH